MYRQKKKGGEEARGFSTVRGAPQNGDGRTTGNPMLCYAGEQLGVAFSVFLIKGVRVASGAQ